MGHTQFRTAAPWIANHFRFARSERFAGQRFPARIVPECILHQPVLQGMKTDDGQPPSCDQAALRVLGLSFAGWNAIASLILAVVAFRGAFKKA